MGDYYVYIMTNKNNTVFYTGVTNDLMRRVAEHKERRDLQSFTARYNVTKLVYCESCKYVKDAIAREKQIKSGSREKKAALVERDNPNWEDLWQTYLET